MHADSRRRIHRLPDWLAHRGSYLAELGWVVGPIPTRPLLATQNVARRRRARGKQSSRLSDPPGANEMYGSQHSTGTSNSAYYERGWPPLTWPDCVSPQTSSTEIEPNLEKPRIQKVSIRSGSAIMVLIPPKFYCGTYLIGIPQCVAVSRFGAGRRATRRSILSHGYTALRLHACKCLCFGQPPLFPKSLEHDGLAELRNANLRLWEEEK